MKRNGSSCSQEIFCLEMLAFRVWIYLLFENISEQTVCCSHNFRAGKYMQPASPPKVIAELWSWSYHAPLDPFLLHFNQIHNLKKISQRCFWILSHHLQLDPKISLCPPDILQYAYRYIFLISSFRRVLYVGILFLGNTPAYGVYMPTFRNTLSVPSS